MARLIGYMASRQDRLGDAFRQEAEALRGATSEPRRAWGIGFYQGDEILHKKQPTPDGAPVDWTAAVGHVRSDCAIAHVRMATVGDFRIENTHPFRLRNWLFAHVGTVAGFADIKERLSADLPDFLGRNMRGNSDSELLFHLVLSKLHGLGHLDTGKPATSMVLNAITQSVKTIDDLCSDAGQSTLTLLLTNGQQMFTLRRGQSMGYVKRTETSSEATNDNDERERANLRYVMFLGSTGELPADYQEIPEAHVAVVDHDTLDVSVSAL